MLRLLQSLSPFAGSSWASALPYVVAIVALALLFRPKMSRTGCRDAGPGAVRCTLGANLTVTTRVDDALRPVRVDHLRAMHLRNGRGGDGLAAFEARREDRSGVYTHENPAQELTAEHAALLAADPRATAFWEAAPPYYRRVCVGWVNGAKRSNCAASRWKLRTR